MLEAIDFKSARVYDLRTTEKAIIAEVMPLTGFTEYAKVKVVFFLNQNEIVRSNIVAFDSGPNFGEYDEVILSVLDMRSQTAPYSGRISFFSPFHKLLLSN
ncbi:MAG: hypothetical protein MUC38_03985 [Cyclobacteriaceae bacterium]|jgi:hypothetical protein|nr:hypothetical protein [Cyclobacteriaceae bacterium]